MSVILYFLLAFLVNDFEDFFFPCFLSLCMSVFAVINRLLKYTVSCRELPSHMFLCFSQVWFPLGTDEDYLPLRVSSQGPGLGWGGSLYRRARCYGDLTGSDQTHLLSVLAVTLPSWSPSLRSDLEMQNASISISCRDSGWLQGGCKVRVCFELLAHYERPAF